jgi:hypothetical protein
LNWHMMSMLSKSLREVIPAFKTSFFKILKTVRKDLFDGP